MLEKAGLISRGRDAQRRPCSLWAEALQAVTAWSEHTRRAWEERFDRFGEQLRELQRRERLGQGRRPVAVPGDAHLRRGDGKTVLTLRQLHPSKAQRDAGFGFGFGAVELGYQTLDKLAEHLEQR